MGRKNALSAAVSPMVTISEHYRAQLAMLFFAVRSQTRGSTHVVDRAIVTWTKAQGVYAGLAV